MEEIKELKVEQNERLISFDVVALYPSVPQNEALDILEEKMKEDATLKVKTPIPAERMMKLFRTCLERTYFVFNNQLYQQIDGLAIEASSSVFLAEIFKQLLEKRALTTFSNPPET